MTIYLYGLVLGRSADLVPPHISGLRSATLRVVPYPPRDLGALVSTLERRSAPDRSSLDDVRAHDHALQSVVHHGSTAVAVRFGQTFASDDDLRAHLAERGGVAARLLREYDGCVEMRLLLREAPVAESSPQPSPLDEVTGPGRAYLERIRADASGGQRTLRLRDALGPLVRAEQVEELPAGRGVVFSHLINRSDENEYRAAIAALSLADARIVGPLALYSFSDTNE